MNMNAKNTTAGIAAVLATVFTLGAVPSVAFAGPPHHGKEHGHGHERENRKVIVRPVRPVVVRQVRPVRPVVVRPVVYRPAPVRYNDARRREEIRRREEARIREEARRRELEQQAKNRQKTKNEWRNLATVGGLTTIYGLLKHDNTITFLGAAGTLYSLNRYEQDRKSQSQINRARAELFSRPSFVRDGRRYDRRLVTKNGTRYYQFVRH